MQKSILGKSVCTVNVIAVSYTHLDVYKRQDIDNKNYIKILIKVKCLCAKTRVRASIKYTITKISIEILSLM